MNYILTGSINKAYFLITYMLALAMGVMAVLPEQVKANEVLSISADSASQANTLMQKEESIDELIAELDTQPSDPGILIRVLGMLKKEDKTAIRVLIKSFNAIKDGDLKKRVADALLMLGSKEPILIDYFINRVKPAVESNMPFPLALDKRGKLIRQQWSHEFIDWCTRNKIEIEICGQDAAYRLPTEVLGLALINTEDVRIRNILLKGLRSSNHFIVVQSAFALGLRQEKGAIDSIIDACKRAPSEFVPLIARNLALFDDPVAQASAEQFVKDKAFLGAFREEVHRIKNVSKGNARP